MKSINLGRGYIKFQFPLHRDPRCNRPILQRIADNTGFSSLYIGILAATKRAKRYPTHFNVSVPFTSGSSLQHLDKALNDLELDVSVPFTSGSSLQQGGNPEPTNIIQFQFPLHRDPRCNFCFSCDA